MSEMTPADLKALERTPLFQTLPRRHRKRVAELATRQATTTTTTSSCAAATPATRSS